jgi:hypothetical protein
VRGRGGIGGGTLGLGVGKVGGGMMEGLRGRGWGSGGLGAGKMCGGKMERLGEGRAKSGGEGAIGLLVVRLCSYELFCMDAGGLCLMVAAIV